MPGWSFFLVSRLGLLNSHCTRTATARMHSVLLLVKDGSICILYKGLLLLHQKFQRHIRGDF
jgi:hypothetical protein